MAERYEDLVWFSCTYLPDGLEKPTRAVKGLWEFADLFGEVKFGLEVTINEPFEPGIPVRQEGVGFEYNEFQDSHRWVATTDLADMKTSFRIQQILYADGTMEKF